MNEFLVDANVLLRYLAQDDARQSKASTLLFEKAEQGELLLHVDILHVAECVYVLTGQYRRPRAEVVRGLLDLIQNPGVLISRIATVHDALIRFASSNVDFQDAWLAAQSAESGHAIASFDRDFDKFKDITRVEPA